MTNGEYDKVELPALNQLQALDWIYQHGLQLVLMSFAGNGKREYFRKVVL